MRNLITKIKIVLLLTASFLTVLSAIWALNQWVIQPQFDRLEQMQALAKTTRVRMALQGELRQLAGLTGAWAEWDEAYAFAERPNPGFIQSNFSDWPQLERNLRLNLGAVLNRAGQVLYLGGYDAELSGPVAPVEFSAMTPATLQLFRPALEKDQPLSGILRTSHGLLLVAAHPILTSQRSGPARGALLFGRFLNPTLLRALAEQSQVVFELFGRDDARLSVEERNYLRTLPSGVSNARPGPDGTPFLYETLADLTGQSVGLIRTPIHQEIAESGRYTGHLVIEILGLSVLVLLLAGAYCYNRFKSGEGMPGDTAAWVAATVTALTGLTLSAGLFLELYQRDRATLEHHFQLTAGQRTGLIVDKLASNLRDLGSVKLFFESSPAVSRETFRRFTTPLLGDGDIAAIEWLPRVARDQRAEFETAARQEGLAEFQFTELDRDGATVRAGERDEYFPIHYCEPYAVHAKAVGFVLSPTDPLRGPALTRALNTGRPTLSQQHIPTLESVPQAAVVAVQPVYEPEAVSDGEKAGRRLKGLVMGIIPVGAVVKNALRDTAPQGIELRLTDLSAPEGSQALYEWAPRLNATSASSVPSNPRYRQDFALADRTWRIELWPNAAFIANHAEQTHLWVPVFGALFTVLATLYLFNLISQRRRAQTLVTARTQQLRANEEYTRAVLDALHDAVIVTDADRGRIIDANLRVSEMYDHLHPLALTLELGQLGLGTPPYSTREFLVWLSKTRELGPQTFEWMARQESGNVFWVEWNTRFATINGRELFILSGRDIAERRRAQTRQRLAATVFESAREAIVVTDPERRMVAVNPAFIQLTGYTESEAIGQSIALFQADYQPESYYQTLWQNVAQNGSWQGEYWSRNKLDNPFVSLVTISEVRNPANQLTNYVLIATDITHQKETEQRIEYLAYYDALTDLPNRTLLGQRAELALALAGRQGKELAVMFLDLDRFKEVNDSLGHAEGDALLVQVATRLRKLTRDTDTICRLGGDEFVLLLPGTGQPGAVRIASKLLFAFGQPFVVAGHHLRITVSVGVALYPHDGANFNELLKNADTALYRAKHEGRNTWVFYTREMNVATFERLMLESQLRKAIETGQLRAYFQPKVHLSDERLAGAEALVRWQHPEHGLIGPGRFIPIAEASSLIIEVSDWMLREVCRQIKSWKNAGMPPLTVAVNLTASHFRDPRFVERIETLLKAHGLDSEALELELTESSLIEAGTQTEDTLLALRRLGLSLAIDDFGTGYSSLSYLKRLPLTALKIDQSFVRNLVTDPDDRVIAATIVALGHALGLNVIAEGVETADQRRILLDQGCDLAQGYLFDPPMPAEQFTVWLTRIASGGDAPSSIP